MSDNTIRPLQSIDRALLAALDRARELTGARRASLFLRDPVTGEAVTRVAHLPEIQEIRLPPGAGIVGAVMKSGEVMDYPGNAPRPSRSVAAATDYDPRTLLALPVSLDNAVVGVLQLLDAPLSRRVRTRALELVEQIEQMLEGSSLAAQLRPRGVQQVRLEYAFEGLIGASAAMSRAFELAAQVATSDASVLITGETGTGTDLFARAIHANSRRAGGAFVKVDCGAIPDTLLENELFGHEQGAFTGAVGRVAGRIEEAEGGTLFLDEVGELSPLAQTRLLRVLEERVVQRLGGGKPQTIDFRLVSATHRDLPAMVRDGRFRADLFHRIQVVPIRLPSLRERGPEDILRLVEHFVEVHARRHERPVRSIAAETQQLLIRHPWPGNVRELSHAVESAVVLSPDGVFSPDLVNLHHGAQEGARGPFDDLPTLAELEQRYLRHLMDLFGGRRTEVARVAGIGRSTLWRKLQASGDD